MLRFLPLVITYSVACLATQEFKGGVLSERSEHQAPDASASSGEVAENVLEGLPVPPNSQIDLSIGPIARLKVGGMSFEETVRFYSERLPAAGFEILGKSEFPGITTFMISGSGDSKQHTIMIQLEGQQVYALLPAREAEYSTAPAGVRDQDRVSTRREQAADVTVRFTISGSALADGSSLDGHIESKHYESRIPFEGESNAIPGTFSISLCEDACNSRSRFVRITGISLNAGRGRYRFGENGLAGYFGHLGALFAYNRNPRGFLEFESFGETLTGHFEFSAEHGDAAASVKGRFEKIPVPRN